MFHRANAILPRFALATVVYLSAASAPAQEIGSRNEATDITIGANQAVREQLPFGDTEDIELANRGFIARPENLVIEDATGRVIWTMTDLVAQDDAVPTTVNPSLWRQMKLNSRYGLFQVSERIYQVRGYDLSNLSVIVGDTGYIVVDPLITAEVAAAAMELVYEHLPKKPVVAVIYSHSHADHFGGVKGVVSEAEVRDGTVSIIAPDGFMEHAASENILAGNVMTRRASYMFGSLLPKDEKGNVGVGIGQAISSGQVTLIEPTDIVTTTGETRQIDGVEFVFMNTPLAEAPAELMFYLPQMKAFYTSEEANGTMHNLYTMRGALIRDALLWSGYLYEAAERMVPETEVLFGGHNWPRWGYDSIVEYLRKHGDTYKYIHDQTLRLANQGYTMNEISEQIDLPDALANTWYTRGYYGTVSHNSRAVYQRYLGFFDGNPSHIQPLPPEDAAKKYVEFMGGADLLLENARQAYENGEYRWVVEVVNHLVFAEPDNLSARELQANALEQLGYQSESGQWRNFYLTGASELRNGVNPLATTRTISVDMISALTLDMFFDYMAVRLNGPAAAGRNIILNFSFTDSGDQYVVDVSNGVLHHWAGRQRETADATIRLGRNGLIALILLGRSVQSLSESGIIEIDGDQAVLEELVSLLDDFEFWFDIVTP